VFGWKIEQMMKKEDGFMNWWSIVTGDSGPGINGGLYERSADNKVYYYDCTIEVPDIDAAVTAVKANGGIITREKSELPNVGFFVSAKDTEGNNFALMQPTGYQPK
jgi:predicted enzyme related to lactoylglutathione lyase